MSPIPEKCTQTQFAGLKFFAARVFVAGQVEPSISVSGWTIDMRTFGNKTTVDVNEAEEFPKFVQSWWQRKITSGLEFGLQGLDAVPDGACVSEELEGRSLHQKRTQRLSFGLSGYNHDTVLLESFEKLEYMVFVLRCFAAGDEEVVIDISVDEVETTGHFVGYKHGN